LEEIWKDIEGYEGKYQISNYGRIKILRPRYKDKIYMNPSADNYGYLHCTLSNSRKEIKVHRVVAETFIPNLENKPMVNHIDGNKQNNRTDNLEWATAHENNLHANRIGLAGGLKHNKSKFNEKQIIFIRKMYKPYDKMLGAKALSELFEVSQTTIKRVAKNKTYRLIEE
jgi:hypothetical protein